MTVEHANKEHTMTFLQIAGWVVGGWITASLLLAALWARIGMALRPNTDLPPFTSHLAEQEA
ncbi:hypothetical protein ACFC14_18570 [Microbacterium sp. NPDC055988]|uniref:hypothetical protein n=1 Tax=Microbacterium sp. NPDC055988 TaxID=3345671 RepID=UPI0035D6064C